MESPRKTGALRWKFRCVVSPRLFRFRRCDFFSTSFYPQTSTACLSCTRQKRPMFPYRRFLYCDHITFRDALLKCIEVTISPETTKTGTAAILTQKEKERERATLERKDCIFKQFSVEFLSKNHIILFQIIKYLPRVSHSVCIRFALRSNIV